MTKQPFNLFAMGNTALLDSVKAFNSLAVANMEKLASLQTQALQSYAKLSMEQLEELAKVKNPNDLQTYFGKQPAVFKAMGEKAVADTKALTELNIEFGNQVQKLAKDTASAVMPKAA